MTPTRAVTVTLLECNRCGNVWPQRFGRKPRKCARCRSGYWDTPRTRRRRVNGELRAL